jgi:hypothetical protein
VIVRPERPPGRLQRIVRIVRLRHQVEFDFRRHHRLPAALGVELDHLLEHVARRVADRVALGGDHVADHLRRRVGFPRHHRKRRQVRHQLQVAIERIVAEIAGLFRIFAGDRVPEHRRGQRQRGVGGEFRRRHHLAARHAGEIRRDALDVLDAANPEPLTGLGPVFDAALDVEILGRGGLRRFC